MPECKNAGRVMIERNNFVAPDIHTSEPDECTTEELDPYWRRDPPAHGYILGREVRFEQITVIVDLLRN